MESVASDEKPLRDENGRLLPGQTPNPGGRPKGTPNKITAEVKEMIKTALNNAGGTKYLEMQAHENPKAFMALVAKIIPAKIDLDVKVMSEEVVGTLAQRRQQMQELRQMRDVTPEEDDAKS